MTKPSVLIVAQDMPSPLDRRVWLEAGTLKRNGYSTVVLCPNSSLFPRFHEYIEGIHIYRYPRLLEGQSIIGIALEYFVAFLLISIYQLIIQVRHNIDFVQYCNPPDFLIFTDFLVKGRRRIIVFDQHDAFPELWLAKGGVNNTFLHRATKWLEKCSISKADAVIFASESFAEKAKLNKYLDAKPFTVLKTAPMSTFGKDLDETRDLSNKETRYIGYIGRMGNQDNVDVLLHSFAILMKKYGHSKIRLKLVGEGPEFENLRELARNLSIEENVEFIGYISDENRLCAEMKLCIVAVCPDFPNEMNNMASMNKISEYMALGLPIVQFNLHENVRTCGDFSYVVKDSDSDNLAEAIHQLLIHDELRSQIAKGAKAKFLTELCWELQEKKLLKIYSKFRPA